MTCVFCQPDELKGRVITENELALAFHALQAIVPGHTLIIPKRCVAKFEDLTEDEQKAIFSLMSTVKAALKKTFHAEGFNHAWNEELIAGQTVPHFHLHVLPRKKGDSGIYEYEPRQFLYRPGSRDDSSRDDLEELTNKIKRNL